MNIQLFLNIESNLEIFFSKNSILSSDESDAESSDREVKKKSHKKSKSDRKHKKKSKVLPKMSF